MPILFENGFAIATYHYQNYCPGGALSKDRYRLAVIGSDPERKAYTVFSRIESIKGYHQVKLQPDYFFDRY